MLSDIGAKGIRRSAVCTASNPQRDSVLSPMR